MDVEGVLEQQPMEIGFFPIYRKEGALWLIWKPLMLFILLFNALGFCPFRLLKSDLLSFFWAA
jgi:hypothetical protein